MLRKRILIVDDDPGILDYLSVVLEEAGFTVTTAEDPDQAFIQAEALKPLLMVLDLKFAREQDGAEMLRRMRSTYRLQYLPIIILTALEPAQALGMIPPDPLVKVSFKPPKREALLDMIRSLTGVSPVARKA